VGTVDTPGGGGVGGDVGTVTRIAVVLEGNTQRGFLQHGFVKSVTRVQYSGRLLYRAQLHNSENVQLGRDIKSMFARIHVVVDFVVVLY